MRPDKRIKVRFPIGAQLIKGEDDDLIKWYASLAPKTGQATIKRLLRTALKMPQPEAPTPVAISNGGEVEVLQQHIKHLEEWIEKIANDLPGYVQTEIRKSLVNGTTLPPPEIRGGEQLEASAIEKREKRLKGSNW